jgi:hypothetical protein
VVGRDGQNGDAADPVERGDVVELARADVRDSSCRLARRSDRHCAAILIGVRRSWGIGAPAIAERSAEELKERSAQFDRHAAELG